MLVRATLPWPPQLNRGRHCAFWMPYLDSIQLPEMDPDSWPSESVCGLIVYGMRMKRCRWAGEEAGCEETREPTSSYLATRQGKEWERHCDEDSLTSRGIPSSEVYDSCVLVPYFEASKRKSVKRDLLTSIPWRHVVLRRRGLIATHFLAFTTLAPLYRTVPFLGFQNTVKYLGSEILFTLLVY